jgi:hypothetical protein
MVERLRTTRIRVPGGIKLQNNLFPGIIKTEGV